ncbi:MAG: glycosyl hydrolase family 28-related protein, partial [Geminicoccaceae bacterium]
MKRDFGAKGDGVDDTDAIEEAFATANHVYFPPGTYISTSARAISNKNIVLEGVDQLSELRFTAASGGGISVTQNDAFVTGVTGLLITTTQQEPGTALSVDYSAIGSLDTHRHLQFLKMRDVEIRGSNVLADGWTKGVFMDECHSPYLENVRIAGRRDTSGSGASEFWPGMTHGIDNRSTQDLSPTNFTFKTVRVRNAGICFNNLGIMEGLRYENCTGVSSRDGIIDDRREILGADTVDPWLTVANCHFNTSQFGIRSINSSQHFIHNNLLYEFQVDLGYSGISLQTGNDPQIHSNHILGNSAAVNASVGIKVNNNNRAFIYANKLQRCDTPIEINDDAAGISGVRAWNNIALDNNNDEMEAVVYTGTASATSNTAVHY